MSLLITGTTVVLNVQFHMHKHHIGNQIIWASCHEDVPIMSKSSVKSFKTD